MLINFVTRQKHTCEANRTLSRVTNRHEISYFKKPCYFLFYLKTNAFYRYLNMI